MSLTKGKSPFIEQYIRRQRDCLLWTVGVFVLPHQSSSVVSEHLLSRFTAATLLVDSSFPVTVYYGDATGNLPRENITHTNLAIDSSHIFDILNEPCSFHCGRFLQHKETILYFCIIQTHLAGLAPAKPKPLLIIMWQFNSNTYTKGMHHFVD